MKRQHAAAVRGALLACALTITVPTAAGAAQAQTYPDKPIRFIVPFSPGGGNDRIARLIGGKLTESWRQQVIVDNRPGAGGNIAAEIVANANPDGYTIFLFNSANAIAPSLHKGLPWHPLKDFEPVILIATSPFALVVHPGIAAQSVKELIALAKAKPRGYNYASGGIGSSTHLAGEQFKQMAGIDVVHVPYKGAGPAYIDLIAGRVAMYFSSLPPALGHVKAGRVRALGISSEKRSPLLPDVPTISEAGVPGYQSGASYGIVAPRGTPAAVIGKLNGEVARILREGDARSTLTRQGADVSGGTPAQFANYMKSEVARWAKVVEAAQVTVK